MEKRDITMSFATSAGIKKKLTGLADMENVTLSEYIERLVVAHVAEKCAEARLLAEALDINIKDL